MRIGILNDITLQQHVGGTELFCDNIIKSASKYGVEAVLITPSNFDELVDSCNNLLATNVATFSKEQIEKLKSLKYYKIEMDYGYCKMRNGLCQYCDLFKDGQCTQGREGYYDLLAKARKIIFLNPFQREFFKRDFGRIVNNSICLLIFMGDLKKFKDYGKVREKNSFLYAGRFFFEKGMDNLLLVAMQNPQANFYFVGWGLQKYLERILNLRNCYYLGKRDISEMPEIYNKYEHFISLPIWFDTGAITLVEAELCGMKIFSNNNNKIRSHKWKDVKELRKMVINSEAKLFSLLKGRCKNENRTRRKNKT